MRVDCDTQGDSHVARERRWHGPARCSGPHRRVCPQAVTVGEIALVAVILIASGTVAWMVLLL